MCNVWCLLLVFLSECRYYTSDWKMRARLIGFETPGEIAPLNAIQATEFRPFFRDWIARVEVVIATEWDHTG
jgi:hypothetical protein